MWRGIAKVKSAHMKRLRELKMFVMCVSKDKTGKKKKKITKAMD